MDTYTNKEITYISKKICEAYPIGTYLGHQYIAIGVVDYTYFLKTTQATYFIKIMKRSKSIEQVNKYQENYELFKEAHVRVPDLHYLDTGPIMALPFQGKTIFITVTDCIPGNNLYSLDENMDISLMQQLLEELSKIITIPSVSLAPRTHKINASLIETLYQDTHTYLDPTINQKGKELIQQLKNINFNALSKSFIHGDLSKGNIIKDRGNKLWIVDIGDCGYGYPLEEVAIILTYLLFDYRDIKESIARAQYFLKEYDTIYPLTAYEKEILPTFIIYEAYCNVAKKTLLYHTGVTPTPQIDFWIQNSAMLLRHFDTYWNGIR